MQKHNEWINFAKQDLAIAILVLSTNVIYKPAFFHAQQCAEKALKGYLAYKKENISMTHNLVVLLWQCKKYHEQFDALFEQACVLNEYTLKSRYPQRLPFIATNELLADAIEGASLVFNFVKKCIT